MQQLWLKLQRVDWLTQKLWVKEQIVLIQILIDLNSFDQSDLITITYKLPVPPNWSTVSLVPRMTNTSTYNQSISLLSVLNCSLIFLMQYSETSSVCSVISELIINAALHEKIWALRQNLQQCLWCDYLCHLQKRRICTGSPSASLALAWTNHIPAWVPERPCWDPKRGLKKSPTLIWAGSCLYNSRCDTDPWFIRRRQKIERIKDHRDDPDVWICDLWEPQTHSCLFLCDEWTSSQWTGTFLFLWEDIWCYSKGYCQSWIH